MCRNESVLDSKGLSLCSLRLCVTQVIAALIPAYCGLSGHGLVRVPPVCALESLYVVDGAT